MHPTEVFLDLLRTAGVEVIADVRSVPFSGRAPQHGQDQLPATLSDAGVRYVWLGEALGARPSDPSHVDARGRGRYDLMAATPTFRAGIDRLLEGAARFRVALMCAEEDPTGCHRRKLVTPALRDRGVVVLHLRADGSLVDDRDLGRDPDQERLFE